MRPVPPSVNAEPGMTNDRVSLPHSLSDAIFETFAKLDDQDPAQLGRRYPVTRDGEREPLPRVLRWLIWHRDRGRCTFCGRGDVSMQLDHVIPWSAGGPDIARNLRTMCGCCNEIRSNLCMPEVPVELLAVTTLCDLCIERHDDGGRPHGPSYAYCPVCTAEQFNRLTHADAEQHLAFCGSCRRRSTVSDPSRLL